MNDSHIQVSKDKVDEMDTRKVKKSTLQSKKRSDAGKMRYSSMIDSPLQLRLNLFPT